MLFERIFEHNGEHGESWLEHAQLPEELAEIDFDTLWTEHPEEFGEVIIFGKKQKMPRWSQSYGADYIYSGVVHSAAPIPEVFQPFFDYANKLGKGKFAQMLVNWYQDGSHSIGRHRDDEKQLIPDSPIISFSLGATRKFRVRDYKDKKILQDIDMQHGDILVMGGKFQKDLTHEVPKITGKKGENTGPRINITFRQYINESGEEEEIIEEEDELSEEVSEEEAYEYEVREFWINKIRELREYISERRESMPSNQTGLPHTSGNLEKEYKQLHDWYTGKLVLPIDAENEHHYKDNYKMRDFVQAIKKGSLGKVTDAMCYDNVDWNEGMWTAFECGNIDMIEHILERARYNDDGFEAASIFDWDEQLACAARVGHLGALEIAKSKGQSVNGKNNWELAMREANEGGHEHIIEYIRSKSCDNEQKGEMSDEEDRWLTVTYQVTSDDYENDDDMYGLFDCFCRSDYFEVDDFSADESSYDEKLKTIVSEGPYHSKQIPEFPQTIEVDDLHKGQTVILALKDVKKSA